MIEYVKENLDIDTSCLNTDNSSPINEDGRIGVANLEYDLYHGSKKTATAAAVGAGALVGKGIQYAGRYARSKTINKQIKKYEKELRDEVDTWLGFNSDPKIAPENIVQQFAKVVEEAFNNVNKYAAAIQAEPSLPDDAKANKLSEIMANNVNQFTNEYKKFLTGFDTKLRQTVTTTTKAIVALIDKGGFFALKSVKTKTKLIRSWNNVIERVNLHAAKRMREALEGKVLPLIPSGFAEVENVLSNIPGSYFSNEDLKKVESYLSMHLKDKTPPSSGGQVGTDGASSIEDTLNKLLAALQKLSITPPPVPPVLPPPTTPATPPSGGSGGSGTPSGGTPTPATPSGGSGTPTPTPTPAPTPTPSGGTPTPTPAPTPSGGSGTGKGRKRATGGGTPRKKPSSGGSGTGGGKKPKPSVVSRVASLFDMD